MKSWLDNVGIVTAVLVPINQMQGALLFYLLNILNIKSTKV